MSMSKFISAPKCILAGTLLVTPLVGCGGPSSITSTQVDPGRAGAKAMELYDTDGDGFVAGEELEKAPGLKAALGKLDTNKDGKVSAEEVSARVKMWQQMKIGIMSFNITITLDGQPLEGAQVTLDPDEFQEGAILAGVGTTSYGECRPMIPKENRPNADWPPGMQAGIFKVRVSKVVDGQETIPSRYNTETTLGVEVAKDNPDILNKRVAFHLQSR